VAARHDFHQRVSVLRRQSCRSSQAPSGRDLPDTDDCWKLDRELALSPENIMLNTSRSSREKVRLHREERSVDRAQGLRPVQIWVPDVRARSFITAARKQSTAVASSKQALIDQRFIDSATEDLDA
jgi:Antitoxin MazE-like